MDPGIKTKWLEALRSGKYKQGQKTLQQGDRFCCLGVLCDVMGVEKAKFGDDDNPGYAFEGSATALIPSGPADRAGLVEGTQWALVDLNDNKGKSFAEIADWIEANL